MIAGGGDAAGGFFVTLELPQDGVKAAPGHEARTWC